MKVGRVVIVVVHKDDDSIESAKLWHFVRLTIPIHGARSDLFPITTSLFFSHPAATMVAELFA
jgi:hypothetical protein